ncbi:MAG: tRNA pseudouridine(38-40) synthase TruA [Acidimicrobiia bacterium]|nr:tRNA pseudouridine(38-40) synthase TruA [Acidimicrobiia bacterium]
MPTYRVDLSYDGTGFHGYAKNRDVRTVQAEIEKALATVFGHPVDTVCAGRTDAGVHARHQVVSFSSQISMDTNRIHRSLTAMLGPEIVALDAMVVPDDFSARFSATMRAYRYRVLTTEKPDPLRRFTTWHQPYQLDLDAMNRAAGHLVGEHDFASFCRQAPDRTSVRTVLSASWLRLDDVCELRVSARAFCQQMVRAVTGLGVAVGRGRLNAAAVPEIIAARDRHACPQIAPPLGLVLWEVGFH